MKRRANLGLIEPIHKGDQIKQEAQKASITSTKSNANSRAANYTIQGFIYQFNVTLHTILDSTDDATITVEGPIEDIDITEPLKTTAIQCKYHEGQATFTLSSIYKPLLQMMDHFHHNQNINVNYHLLAHFPNIDVFVTRQITYTEIMEMLNTTNKDLQIYTKALKGNVDVTRFLNRFLMRFGPSLGDIENQVCEKLQALGFQDADIPFVVYPNAIHYIARLSIKPNARDRVINKLTLLAWLHKIKTTTISRWTLALKSAHKLLAERKKQLQPNLSLNTRRRTFLISETTVKDFDENVVLFIYEYVNRYHYKSVHTKTPLFCLDCDQSTFDDIRLRLHEKEIIANDGYIGPYFNASHFARAPIVITKRDKPEREFCIRLIRYETDPTVLNTPKCDDFFILSAKGYPQLDFKDVNEEYLSTETLQQAKFLLGVSHDHK